MNTILKLHDALIGAITAMFGEWFLPTFARFSFAAVLLCYFWNSAMTKLGDGFFGFLSPNETAFYQVFPGKTEEFGFDISQFNTFEHFIVVAGTVAEFLLPTLILIGLITRLAALGMAGFVAVQTFVDITGHGVDAKTIGGWFDGPSNALIFDQRLLWMVLFAVMVVKGAGPLSLDRLLRRNTA